MPAERIAQNLAFINWTVLFSMAAGIVAAVALAMARTEATRGYLAFTAATGAAFAALGALSDGGLPPADPDTVGLEAVRRVALWAGAALAVLLSVGVARGRRSGRLGLAALAPFAIVLVVSAVTWTVDGPAAALLGLQLAVLAGATGGAWSAMILGHWYLVTPKLPIGPLVLVARVLFGLVVIQIGLFVLWVGLGIGPAGIFGFGALTGEWALFVWLRLLVGLAFPVAAAWAAVQTARTRSMESATGLLYVGLGTVAVGTILAAGLYFGAGLLV